MKSYLISAIISIYNCEKFIEGCLIDLEEQTIANRLEIIAVNTGSQQNERAIIEKFQKEFDNIVYIETTKRGTIYSAWNRGIKASSGKYITNANSDDRHSKDAFEIMVNVLENNADIDLVYPNYLVTETENETFEKCTSVGSIEPPDYDRLKLLFGCLPHAQPMWRKKIHDEYGFFNENLSVVGDQEFWLRISDKCNFKHIHEYLGLYLRNPNGAERRNFILSMNEAMKVTNEYIEMYFLKEISHDQKMIKMIRHKQSEFAFRQGDALYHKGYIGEARKRFHSSIKYNFFFIKSYEWLFACYLPPKLISLLEHYKSIIEKRFENSSEQ